MIFPEQYRFSPPGSYHSRTGDPFGAFLLPGNEHSRPLCIIASDGRGESPGDECDVGWEHVSVSILDSYKPPGWPEMCRVKDLFWEPEACVVQFHPPKSDYINHHPGVLHLWRKIDGHFPMPPKICV